MALSTKEVADFYNKVDAFNGTTAKTILGWMLVRSLSPQEKKLFDLIKAGVNTSYDLEKKLKWQRNHVATILGNLYNYGLLKRIEKRSPGGRYYEYSKC